MAQGTPSGRTRVVAAGRTDVGRRRKHNEDTVLLRPELKLYVVADGMGGHNAGEVASALAAKSIDNFFLATRTGALPAEFAGETDGLSHDAVRLAAAARKANSDVWEIASTRRQHAGMGSTLVAAAVSEADRKVHICHAGDSRCYRIRDGEIEQLTRDHSLINDALAMKPDLTEEMLSELPKNVITRAIGTQESLEVDLRSEPLRPGDVYLLCSDGLSGLVNPEQILETSELTGDLEEMCDLLVIMANEAGGIDNVSVVLFRIEEVDGVTAAANGGPAAGATIELNAAEESPFPPRIAAGTARVDGAEGVDASGARARATEQGRARDGGAGDVQPDIVVGADHAPLPAGSPEPRESGIRVVSRSDDDDFDEVTTDVSELDADLATAEELADIAAEFADEEGIPEEPPVQLAAPSVPPRPVKRGPAVAVRAIISVGVPEPPEPETDSARQSLRPAPLPAPDGEVLVCTVCGAEALVGNRFCVECGTRHEPTTAAVVHRSELPMASDGQVEVTMDETAPRPDEDDDFTGEPEEDYLALSPSPSQAASAPTFCHNCGTKIIEDNRFCVACGSRVR